MSEVNTQSDNSDTYSVGDTVMSTRSCSRLVIAKVDLESRMYVDNEHRAISFDECYRI